MRYHTCSVTDMETYVVASTEAYTRPRIDTKMGLLDGRFTYADDVPNFVGERMWYIVRGYVAE